MLAKKALVIRGVPTRKLQGGLRMLNKIEEIKRKLDEAIKTVCDAIGIFSVHPERDFTRERILTPDKLLWFLLSMEGGVLGTEMLNHFGCSVTTPSPSAFVQQRAKIGPDMLPALLELFIQKTDLDKRYKGLRLLAADGSDIHIPTNPHEPDSYFPGTATQKPYNLLHLDAVYDLLQHTYLDAELLGRRKANERASLCSLVDVSKIQKALLIADRGYEGYNVMAHIQEKGWFFLIRIQDILNSNGIAAGLDLPHTDEFDFFVDLSLTKKQTNEVKLLFIHRNQFRYLHKSFDYLTQKNRKHDPAVFYRLPFRIVRFKIGADSYETVVTNLDATLFPAQEIKKLYNMRWGIETSFRELKYTIGLLHFHAKKVENIYQEVFARLIMYNFSELITSHVIIQRTNAKYDYKANFTIAVHVCRQFLRGNISPPDVEALIRRHVSPIRPGRSRPRKMTVKHAVSFIYRVA